MTENKCQHFDDYKNEFGVKTFTLVHGCFSACVNKEARKRKALSCLCFECGSSGPLLFSCLHCIYFGCKGEHILNHLKEKNHTIALELSFGTLYCSSCKDFIYDEECHKIAEKHLGLEARSLNRKLSWRPWIPKPSEVDLLLKHSRRQCIKLRGLYNLGSTCFMNVIIQILLRTPILNDYLLSGQHKCELKIPSECLVCELSKVFREFCSDNRKPLLLNHVLYLVWSHAKHLAGYAQNDAHEFLTTTLEILQDHSNIDENFDNHIPGIQNNGKATKFNTIINRTFTGYSQSTVVCQICKHVSPTIEEMNDLSLELGEGPRDSTPPKTLIECLKRYTRVEYLKDANKIDCSNCKTFQEGTKQYLIHSLPSVANFHLKRFEHIEDEVEKKISTFISFPAELDMTPFMSRKPDNKHQHNDNEFRYSLYAVVNHEGTKDSGHYTAFVRHRKDFWVKCNDQKIRKVKFEEVKESQAYMLSYHKKELEYK